MKYNDNGTYKDIYVKTFDTLPVGAEVDYDGETVPSGWTEVENYSTTEEVDTGKIWINSKPIYRKVYTGTSFITGGSQNYVELGSDIDELIGYSGYIQSSDSVQWGIPFYRGDRFSNLIKLTQNTLRLDVDKTATYNQYSLWVEYTKTTD